MTKYRASGRPDLRRAVRCACSADEAEDFIGRTTSSTSMRSSRIEVPSPPQPPNRRRECGGPRSVRPLTPAREQAPRRARPELPRGPARRPRAASSGRSRPARPCADRVRTGSGRDARARGHGQRAARRPPRRGLRVRWRLRIGAADTAGRRAVRSSAWPGRARPGDPRCLSAARARPGSVCWWARGTVVAVRGASASTWSRSRPRCAASGPHVCSSWRREVPSGRADGVRARARTLAAALPFPRCARSCATLRPIRSPAAAGPGPTAAMDRGGAALHIWGPVSGDSLFAGPTRRYSSALDCLRGIRRQSAVSVMVVDLTGRSSTRASARGAPTDPRADCRELGRRGDVRRPLALSEPAVAWAERQPLDAGQGPPPAVIAAGFEIARSERRIGLCRPRRASELGFGPLHELAADSSAYWLVKSARGTPETGTMEMSDRGELDRTPLPVLCLGSPRPVRGCSAPAARPARSVPLPRGAPISADEPGGETSGAGCSHAGRIDRARRLQAACTDHVSGTQEEMTLLDLGLLEPKHLSSRSRTRCARRWSSASVGRAAASRRVEREPRPPRGARGASAPILYALIDKGIDALEPPTDVLVDLVPLDQNSARNRASVDGRAACARTGGGRVRSRRIDGSLYAVERAPARAHAARDGAGPARADRRRPRRRLQPPEEPAGRPLLTELEIVVRELAAGRGSCWARACGGPRGTARRRRLERGVLED